MQARKHGWTPVSFIALPLSLCCLRASSSDFVAVLCIRPTCNCCSPQPPCPPDLSICQLQFFLIFYEGQSSLFLFSSRSRAGRLTKSPKPGAIHAPKLHSALDININQDPIGCHRKRQQVYQQDQSILTTTTRVLALLNRSTEAWQTLSLQTRLHQYNELSQLAIFPFIVHWTRSFGSPLSVFVWISGHLSAIAPMYFSVRAWCTWLHCRFAERNLVDY